MVTGRFCENRVRMPIRCDALNHEDMPAVVQGPDPRAVKAAISGGTSGAGVSMSNLSGSGTMDSGSIVSDWA
jgi:hypothetical protein